jgi:2-(1,2-epoxy-1,2-dihydrophenyl)acetyl-CoA isomerase
VIVKVGDVDTRLIGKTLLVEGDGPVRVLTLNRPAKLNALDHALVRRLAEALEEIANDATARAVVLTGAGRAFCSGADLGGGPSDPGLILKELYNPLVRRMLTLELPIVAAVNGVAAGGGVSLALACDLRVMATEADFRLSFVKVGLVPDAGATWLLPRLVGMGRAAEMAFLGVPVRAEKALEYGLVGAVAPAAEIRDHAVRIAQALAELGPAVLSTKRALRNGVTNTLDAQLEYEAFLQGQAQHNPEFTAARACFRGGRGDR